MQQPPSNMGGATGELRSDAQQLTSKATDRLHSEVDARKGEAVSRAQSVTSAIRQTADGLDDNAPQWLRSALQQGAEQIQRFADSIEHKDSRQLVSDVQSFARERPALFLGVAAAAGFAVARVLKAGGDQQTQQQLGGSSEWDRSQPWGAGEQSFDDDFGRSDNFGEQFNEGTPSAQPFMARPETQSPTSSQFEQNRMEDDPLVLGTGGESGQRIPGTGDMS